MQFKGNFQQMVAFQTCFNGSTEILIELIWKWSSNLNIESSLGLSGAQTIISQEITFKNIFQKICTPILNTSYFLY